MSSINALLYEIIDINGCRLKSHEFSNESQSCFDIMLFSETILSTFSLLPTKTGNWSIFSTWQLNVELLTRNRLIPTLLDIKPSK